MTADRPRAALFPRRTGFPGQIFGDSSERQKILPNPERFAPKSKYRNAKKAFPARESDLEFQTRSIRSKPEIFGSKRILLVRSQKIRFEKWLFGPKPEDSNPRLKYSSRKGFIRFEKQRWTANFSDSFRKIRIRALTRRIRFEISTLPSKNKYREESFRI